MNKLLRAMAVREIKRILTPSLFQRFAGNVTPGEEELCAVLRDTVDHMSDETLVGCMMAAYPEDKMNSEDRYNRYCVTRDVLLEVCDERTRQDDKWGEQNHAANEWMTVLGEEFGEACKAVLEKDLTNYRDELIQVAAVAVAAVECLDRLTKKETPSDE